MTWLGYDDSLDTDIPGRQTEKMDQHRLPPWCLEPCSLKSWGGGWSCLDPGVEAGGSGQSNQSQTNTYIYVMCYMLCAGRLWAALSIKVPHLVFFLIQLVFSFSSLQWMNEWTLGIGMDTSEFQVRIFFQVSIFAPYPSPKSLQFLVGSTPGSTISFE